MTLQQPPETLSEYYSTEEEEDDDDDLEMPEIDTLKLTLVLVPLLAKAAGRLCNGIMTT
jgi:hypothetical protein